MSAARKDILEVVLDEPSTRPRASAQALTPQWIPAGQRVSIGEITIPDGMVYVGRRPSAFVDYHPDPAFIDTGLPIGRAPATAAEPPGLWPSYGRISPGARRAYLEWLAGGRTQPGVDIGYVYLFFYGLERRMLEDLPGSPDADIEYPKLIVEVRRLLSLYGGPSSPFKTSATGLLSFLDFQDGNPDLRDYRPQDEERTWVWPERLKWGLAAFAANQQPIPWNWALGWYTCSQEAGYSLRTPATRCREEFHQLFARRYAAKFGPGLMLKPNAKKLSMSYQPASSVLRPFRIDCRGLSDVTALTAPLKKIDPIVQECTDALDAYSRYLGRNKGAEDSLAAVSLLPTELVASHSGQELVAFRQGLAELLRERETVVVKAEGLILKYLCVMVDGGKMGRKDMEGLAALLEKCGYGMEPDLRFGGPCLQLGDCVALFRSPQGITDAPSEQYQVAQLVLHLFWLVASADGVISEEENAHLTEFVRDQSGLSGAEKARLKAHGKWLAHAKPGPAGLKKRIGALSAEQRHLLGQFLIGVAGAGGGVSPDEVKVLTNLYTLLGLPEQDLHSDIHAVASGMAPTDPVVVARGGKAGSGTPIPKPPGKAGPENGAGLDRGLIEQRARETAQVAQLLEGIFSEDDPEPSAFVDTTPSEGCLLGLDAAHSALVRDLAGRDSLSREEWDGLARKHCLLPEGALDTINECALEACGECLCEGEETLAIDEQTLKEMLE